MLKAYSLAAVLVVAVHLGVASSSSVWNELYRLSIPSRDDALRLEANLQLARKDALGANVLLMGSSQTREDFEIDYLNRRFRGRERFFNLGFSGNGNPIEMYMLTPRVINAKPKLIIYMPFIGSLFRPYAYNTFDLYFDPDILPLIHSLYGWSEIVEHRDVIASGVLRYSSVLFRYRDSFQHMVDDAVHRWVANSPAKTPQTFAYHRRKPREHFQTLIAKHKRVPRYSEHPYRALYQAAFHKMIQSLKEQNIPLLVVEGPTHPLIQHFYDPALNPIYDEFFTNASTSHAFTYLRTSELPQFHDADFNDFTHLNAAGRARLNAFIADYLTANAARLGLAGE